MIARLGKKNLHTWLPGYLRQRLQTVTTPRSAEPRHLLFCFCDHFEPLWGGADAERGKKRVRAWRLGYPKLAQGFTDADGRPPRHSFFFPGEQYAPELLEP